VRTILFDVETTGLPNYNLRARDPSQPHLVQFAGILLDGDLEVEHFTAIVKPDGWVIPDDVAAIHGITQDRAMAEGIPEASVIELFHAWMRESGLLVAHNLTFDKFLMRIAARRYDVITDADDPWWKEYPGFCTMKASTNICRIPATNGRGYKFPRLAEAYRHAFGRELQGAHDALVDVRACAEVYRWLVAQGHGPKEAPTEAPAVVPGVAEILAANGGR
jgi:DNA polymerase-3 subunit epsilon